MYKTEGVSAVASVTELRMETGDVIDHLQDIPVIGIQRNHEPVAALLSMDMYRKVKSVLSDAGTALEDL